MTTLEIKDLHASVFTPEGDEVPILKGVNLTVKSGETHAVMGPNGSGKTTVFNLISGTMTPDKGEILLGGEHLERISPWSRAHHGLGRTFQITRLFREMTVLENVVAPLRSFSVGQLGLGAVSGSEAARAEELLEFVGMAAYRDARRAVIEKAEAAAREMLRPNIIVGSSPGPTAELPGRAIASTYAMGLQVQDYRGERIASHGGGSPGGISATVLIPGRKIGFSVFTNAEESFLLRALRSGLSDIAMNKVDVDWIADSKRLEAEGIEKSLAAAVEIDAKQKAGTRPSLPLDRYVGTWRDPWYGDIVVSRRGRGLWLDFTHTPALKGPLEPYDGETFRTRFPDKREEDAFITFALRDGRPETATMKGVSPDIDFSYDYQDLRLTRV